MTDVQLPMPAPTHSSRIPRGRLLRVLTLGKPQEAPDLAHKRSKMFRKLKEDADRDETQNASTVQLPEVLGPSVTRSNASDNIVPAPVGVQDTHLQDSEPSPPARADAVAATNHSPASSAPTILKRLTTRLRSISRPREPGSLSARTEAPPPVPNAPTDSRSKVLSQKAKRATLFAGLTKSTPSLVSPVSPSVETAPTVPAVPSNPPPHVARRSSAPKLNSTPALPLRNGFPERPNGRAPGPLDPASVPLPKSPLDAPFSDEPLSLSAAQPGRRILKVGSSKDSGMPEASQAPLAQNHTVAVCASPLTNIPKSPSNFFVGDESDTEIDSPISAPAGNPPSIHQGAAQRTPRPRSATYESPAREKGSPRRNSPPTAFAAGNEGARENGRNRPKTMFAGWRKSVHMDTSSSPTSHTRNSSSSAGSVSSYEAGGNKRASLVASRTPALYTGGFAKEEERIQDPESRRLTENAFM